MYELKILGEQNIDDMKFTGIEGGFGEDKKAILAKDIADIHGKKLKHINEAINNNRIRFKDGIDIIELKSADSIDRDFFNNLGFSNSSIAKCKQYLYFV